MIKHEALAIRKNRERLLGRPPAAEREGEGEDWIHLIPWQGSGPDESAEKRELVDRSREALAKLKPHELKALTQLAEGYSYAEIADLNGWTRTKVNRCLAEGRARFRAVFRESEAGERCASLEPLISASCDGELTGPDLTEIRNHLAACGQCRATLRAFRAAPKAAAALLPAAPVSQSLWEKAQELAISAQLRLQGLGRGSEDSVGTGGGHRWHPWRRRSRSGEARHGLPRYGRGCRRMRRGRGASRPGHQREAAAAGRDRATGGTNPRSSKRPDRRRRNPPRRPNPPRQSRPAGRDPATADPARRWPSNRHRRRADAGRAGVHPRGGRYPGTGFRSAPAGPRAFAPGGITVGPGRRRRGVRTMTGTAESGTCSPWHFSRRHRLSRHRFRRRG